MEIWVTTDPNTDRTDSEQRLVLCVVARGRGEGTWSALVVGNRTTPMWSEMG